MQSVARSSLAFARMAGFGLVGLVVFAEGGYYLVVTVVLLLRLFVVK